MIKFVGTLPQPLKSFYVAFFIVFAVTFVSIPLRLGVARWSIPALGAVALLIGLCLLSNFRGSALGLAAAAKEYRPMGVDYSQSFMATPTFARLFGALFIIVGGGFIIASITNPLAFGH